MKVTFLTLGLMGAILGATSAFAQTTPADPTPPSATTPADPTVMAKADTPAPKTPPKPVCHTVAREGSMTRRTICN